MDKHIIVIVTFNRLALLKECVEACLAQTLPCSGILIVDNASTDGTWAYLEEQKKNPVIHPVRMKENLGGAGGFAEALRLADAEECDWITVIDDDAILRPDFLERIQHRIREDRGSCLCYAGVPLTEGIRPGHRRRVQGKLVKKEVPVPLEEYQQEVFSCDIASFCGLVMHRSLIGRIGLPRADFFIWYDDTEYCLRIRKETEIRTVTAAVIDHKAPMGGGEPGEVSWKEYYGIRNRIFMARQHYGFFTAFLIAGKKYIGGLGLCKKNRRNGRADANKRIRGLYGDGIRDGFAGRLGKNERYAPGAKK